MAFIAICAGLFLTAFGVAALLSCTYLGIRTIARCGRQATNKSCVTDQTVDLAAVLLNLVFWGLNISLAVLAVLHSWQ